MTEKFTVKRCSDCRYVHEEEGRFCLRCRGRVQSVEVVVLKDVIEALEMAFHPQNPSPMHPADLITWRFKGEGWEGFEPRDV